MDIVLMNKLVLEETLRKLQPCLNVVHRVDRDDIRFLHMAPPVDITNVGELNRLLALLNGSLARLGRPDMLSFREEFGVLHLARLSWNNVVVAVYPTRWHAEQMAATNPCPAHQVSISMADLAA